MVFEHSDELWGVDSSVNALWKLYATSVDEGKTFRLTKQIGWMEIWGGKLGWFVARLGAYLQETAIYHNLADCDRGHVCSTGNKTLLITWWIGGGPLHRSEPTRNRKCKFLSFSFSAISHGPCFRTILYLYTFFATSLSQSSCGNWIHQLDSYTAVIFSTGYNFQSPQTIPSFPGDLLCTVDIYFNYTDKVW